MNAKVVSVINFKGGVGKSTVTFNLGSELNRNGYKVLLIDFDGQGTLTSFTGIQQKCDCTNNLITALNCVIEHEEITRNPIYEIRKDFDIVPCDISKEGWMNSALSVLARETILKRYIDTLRELYDYILIDNAPSINLDLQNSLVASDYYLLVTEAESASTEGADTVTGIINEIKGIFNLKLKSAGVVINKVETRTNLHNGIIKAIKEIWKEDSFYIIPKSIIAAESQFLCLPITEHESKSKIADAFRLLTREFLEVTK